MTFLLIAMALATIPLAIGAWADAGVTDSEATGRYAGPLGLNFPAPPGSDFVTFGQDLANRE